MWCVPRDQIHIQKSVVYQKFVVYQENRCVSQIPYAFNDGKNI